MDTNLRRSWRTLKCKILSALWPTCISLILFMHQLYYVESTSNQAGNEKSSNVTLRCNDLLPGQYWCDEPEIDPKTQQAKDCPEDILQVDVPCYPVRGIHCDGKGLSGEEIVFQKKVACKWTNGHSFSTALILSVFLGMFGIDRFYLGYPALGLLKLCTLGFMFLGQLIDILLIALQIVGPSDGSYYVIDYYGAGLTMVREDNMTYIKPQY